MCIKKGNKETFSKDKKIQGKWRSSIQTCGPMNVPNRQGNPHFVPFIDDFSRYVLAFLIFHKYEPIDCFKFLAKEVQNKFDRKIKTLRTDRGVEYTSKIFKFFCQENGIFRQLTMSYTSQQMELRKEGT